MTTTPSTSGAGSPDTTEHPLAAAGRDVGQGAGEVVNRATDIGFQRADQGKQQVAEGLAQLAGSIRRISSEMESEQPTIASVASTAAEQADRIASYLRDTDARGMLRSVEDVARRQPLLFLGGAFLLGAAASRFLKAGAGSSSRSSQPQWGSMNGGSRSGYGSGDGSETGYGSGYRGGGSEAYRATRPGAATGVSATTDEGL